LEILSYRKDGSSFWNAIRIAPVHDADGSIIAFVSILRDVTEERLREAQERQHQKLEALGQLAGGIAHEINNLLQPILTLGNLNLKRADLPSSIHEDFTDILSSARQCRDVVHAVLAFARKESAPSEPVRLDTAVESTLTFAQGVLPPSIQVRGHINGGSAVAMVGRTELTQVLMNLLTNAMDAMEGTGLITVTLENGQKDDRSCRLTVCDQGCGMDEPLQQRIFEPFFTTKPQGKGTGLGLSVVHGIVRSWGGSIAVHSAKGQGTRVEIVIPCTVGQAEPMPGVSKRATTAPLLAARTS